MRTEIPNQRSAGTIALLSDIAPGPGTGSGIVLERHLTRLQSEGWRVILILPEHAVALAGVLQADWRLVTIPRRMWWWPPVRSELPLSETLREYLVARYVRQQIASEGISHLVTLLWGPVAAIAPHLAQSMGVKSYVIIHDQEELWTSGEAAERVRARNSKVATLAHCVFPVTHQQGRCYGVPDERICQLYPIPGGRNAEFPAERKMASAPVLACAGSIHTWHYAVLRPLADALAKRGGTLLLVGGDDNEVCRRLSAESKAVRVVPRFAQNAEAIAHVAENATAFLVAYAVDQSQQRWSSSSFPSKLLDFAFADVPAVLICPEETEVWSWARSRSLPFCWSNISPEVARQIVSELSDPRAWSAALKALRSIRDAEFSADAIHGRFRDTLLGTAACG